MLKSYKYILVVVLAIAIQFESVAQSSIYKDVLLDGKPAKLNTETGEVILVSKVDEKTAVTDSLVRPQSTLTVKDSTKVKSLSTDAKSDIQAKTSLVYEIGTPTEQVAKTDFHTVKKGETLYGLSRRYGATLAELKQANNLETTLIKPGQILRVQNFEALKDRDTWLVTKGDTLYNIAKRNNTTVDELKRLNNLSSNLIKIGQVLRLK